MAAVSTGDFDRALTFSLTKRGTPDINLKPKQLEALRAVVQQKRDVLAVLPTGYGKSLIYQLLPNMFNFLFHGGHYCSIAIIVSPLTALMMDQVEKIKKQGQSAAIIQANCSEADNDLGIMVQGDSVDNVLCGRVSIVFAHPEVLVSSKKCREMLLSDVYQKNVDCVVADEAHCIVDW